MLSIGMGTIANLNMVAGYIASFEAAARENKRLPPNAELDAHLRQGNLTGHFWARQLVLVSPHCKLKKGHDFTDFTNNFLLRADPLLEADKASDKKIFNCGSELRVMAIIDPLSFEQDPHHGKLMQIVHSASIILVENPMLLNGHAGKADKNGFPTMASHLGDVSANDLRIILIRDGISPIMRGAGVFGFSWNTIDLQYFSSHLAYALAYSE